MITDDDITQLTERPTLLERAKEAQRERLRAKKAEEDEEYADLEVEAFHVMREILQMTEGEISECCDFRRGMHNSERVKLEWSVPGFDLRVRNEIKNHTFTSGGQTQNIPYHSPLYEFRPRKTSNWSKFTTLADLGKPFGVTI